jgi:hypothetical protein
MYVGLGLYMRLLSDKTSHIVRLDALKHFMAAKNVVLQHSSIRRHVRL